MYAWTVYPGQTESFITKPKPKPGPKKGFKYNPTHKVKVNGRTYTVPMRYTLINIEELNKLRAAAGAQKSSPVSLKDTIIRAPEKMALEPLAWSCLTRAMGALPAIGRETLGAALPLVAVAFLAQAGFANWFQGEALEKVVAGIVLSTCFAM